jgi:hypothetical protein
MAATKQQIALQKELNELKKQGLTNSQEFEKIQIRINGIRKGEQTTLATIIKSMEKVTTTAKKTTGELTKQQKITEKVQALEYKQIDIVATLNAGYKDNLKNFMGIGKQATSIADKLKAQYKEQLKGRKLTKSMYNQLVSNADETAEIAKNMEIIAKSPIADEMGELESYASNAASKIEGIFTAVPGGGTLFKYLGGGELNEQLKSAVIKGAADMAKAMGPARDAMGRFAKKGSKDVVQGGKDMVGALSDGMKGFIGQVKGIPNIGIILGIGAVIVVFAALYALLSSISKEAHKFAEETGVTYAQAKKLNDEARKTQASFSTQLATMEDITAVQKEQIALLGSAALVNTKIAASVADTGRAFGYSAEQAGKTHAALMLMGASQQEAADIQLKTSAAALKAGVNVAAVQQDIADNAKDAAAYLGGSAEALADAAVEAAKLGISLGQMTKMADGLLSIESSLSKQFRASALIGRQLNFDTARQLALKGDIAGASKAILEQMGGIAEFEKMSVVQKKAMADAAGMTVEELTKSMMIQDKLGDLTDEQKASMANLKMSAAEMGKLSAKDLKNKLAQQQSLDKAGAAFESIKNQLTTALLPLAEAFGAVFTILGPVLKGLGFALKIAFLPLTLITKGFQKIWEFIQASKEALAAFTIVATTLLGVQTAIAFQKKQGLLYDIASVVQGGLKFAWTVATGAAEQFNNKRKKQGLFATLAEMAMKAFTSLANIPIVGPLLGAAAFATAVGLGMKYIGKAGDVKSPAKGKTQISTKEGGIFETSKNDDVAAGPGLLGKLGAAAADPFGTIGSLFGGGDEKPSGFTAEQVTQIIGLLTTISTRPVPVQIGEAQIREINNGISAQNSMGQ